MFKGREKLIQNELMVVKSKKKSHYFRLWLQVLFSNIIKNLFDHLEKIIIYQRCYETPTNDHPKVRVCEIACC